MEEKNGKTIRLSTAVLLFIILILIAALAVTYYFGFVKKNEEVKENKNVEQIAGNNIKPGDEQEKQQEKTCKVYDDDINGFHIIRLYNDNTVTIEYTDKWIDGKMYQDYIEESNVKTNTEYEILDASNEKIKDIEIRNVGEAYGSGGAGIQIWIHGEKNLYYFSSDVIPEKNSAAKKILESENCTIEGIERFTLGFDSIVRDNISNKTYVFYDAKLFDIDEKIVRSDNFVSLGNTIDWAIKEFDKIIISKITKSEDNYMLTGKYENGKIYDVIMFTDGNTIVNDKSTNSKYKLQDSKAEKLINANKLENTTLYGKEDGSLEICIEAK